MPFRKEYQQSLLSYSQLHVPGDERPSLSNRIPKDMVDLDQHSFMIRFLCQTLSFTSSASAWALTLGWLLRDFKHICYIIPIIHLLLVGPISLLFELRYIDFWASSRFIQFLKILAGVLSMWTIYAGISTFAFDHPYKHEKQFRWEVTMKVFPQVLFCFIYLISDNDKDYKLNIFTFFTLAVFLICLALDRLIQYSVNKIQTAFAHFIYTIELWADIFLRVSSIVLFAHALPDVRYVLPIFVYIFELVSSFSMGVDALKVNKKSGGLKTADLREKFKISLIFGLYGLIGAYNYEIHMRGHRYKAMVVEEVARFLMSYLFIMFANGVDPSLNKWVWPCWIAMALYLVCKLFRFFLTATQHRRRKHAQKYRDRLRARLAHERTFIRYEISESDDEDHEGTDWEKETRRTAVSFYSGTRSGLSI